MKTKNIPLLLAPAGSMKALQAAISAGADEVYLSGKKFGARQYASNFNKPELEEAIKNAHLNSVRLYVTVNTLLKDEEIKDASDYLLWLYEKGVDGIIVQDLGLASIAKKIVPDLELHASTQMTIHNQEGIEWAANFGFKRAILAREMNLNHIKEIPPALTNKIELEVFIHGALCYSYSGQCLISSLIGGRSGNRGTCAQSCRRRYKLLQGYKDKYGRPFDLKIKNNIGDYLLSPRDLELYSNFDKLSDTPIKSLKIEGRMRSPEYVALVVNIYRNALDELKQGNWKPKEEIISELKLAFNRGFTKGHMLEAHPNNIIQAHNPSNKGLKIGKVLKIDKKTFRGTLELNSSNFIPEIKDGLVFVDPHSQKKVGGMIVKDQPTLNRNRMKINLPNNVKAGYHVFLTRKNTLNQKANNLMVKTNPIPLDLKLELDKQNRVTIKAFVYLKNGKNKNIVYNSDYKMQKAKKSPLTKNQIIKQLKRTGKTQFIIRNFELNYNEDLFAPISQINQMRRDLLLKIEEEILKSYQPSNKSKLRARNNLKNYFKKTSMNPQRSFYHNIGVWVDDLTSLKESTSKNSHPIYFQPKIDKNNINTEKLAKDLLKAIKISNEELIWKWPPISSPNFLKSVKRLLEYYYENGGRGVMVDNLGAAHFILKNNPNLKLHGSSGLNIWNHHSIQQLKPNFESITLSPELDRKSYQNIIKSMIKPPKIDLLVQGNLEVMISENTLIPTKIKENQFWGIKDEKDILFPVTKDYNNRTIVLNSKELCLINYIPSLLRMGVDNLIIDARNKTTSYTKQMISFYQNALQITQNNPNNLSEELESLKNQVKKISSGGITSGNFVRGLKI